MISGKIHTRDGELVFVRDEKDFVQLVEREIGYDAAQLARELADLADMTQQRLQTDLNSYESELSELQIAIRDLDRKPDALIAISNKQRINAADKRELRRLAEMIRGLLSLAP